MAQQQQLAIQGNALMVVPPAPAHNTCEICHAPAPGSICDRCRVAAALVAERAGRYGDQIFGSPKLAAQCLECTKCIILAFFVLATFFIVALAFVGHTWITLKSDDSYFHLGNTASANALFGDNTPPPGND